MSRIKVLLIAGAMNVGGIENQLMHLLRKADKEKFQIDFTTTVEHPFYEDEILSLGAKLIHLPPTEGKHFLRYCKALYRVLKEGQYDVVHSHELFHSGMVLLTARLAGVKHRFVHAHSSNQDYGRNWKRHFYNAVMRAMIHANATAYFACSSLAGEFLYGKKTLKKANYHLLVNSVDTHAFLAEAKNVPEYDFFSGWKNVLQVGRFSDEKNFLFTARLAEECRKRANGIRFLCVGNDGSHYEELVREKIAEFHIEEQMVLLGVRKDVAALMKRADAFILPSKYEGMPLTLIEAQASCLPCVAADTFSHEVDFGVGSVVWLSLADDPAEWVDALEAAVNQGKADRESVVKAIREAGFDSTDFANRLCMYYEKACSEE